MATHNISVTVKDRGPHLNFQEDGHTEEGINFETIVNPGDTMVWSKGANSGIFSFEGVRMYTDDTTGTDLFKDLTVTADEMRATVITPAETKHGELHENYFVKFRAVAGGPIIEEDPKVRMRST